MLARYLATRVIPALALGLSLLCGGVSSALADQAPPPADHLEMVNLKQSDANPQDPNAPMSFHAVINYQLTSASTGFFLLFAFENNSQQSTIHSTDEVPATQGNGQAQLDLTYTPRDGVDNVSLIAAMFRPDKTLLAWGGTRPVAISAWRASAAFDNALASESAGNFSQAIDLLSTAISLQPEVAKFYYWRADNRLRLGQYDAAIDDYNQALTITPGDRATLVGRGVANLWKGQWQQAVDDETTVINAGVAADQTTAWAHRARGLAYAGLHQSANAIADYQAYLNLSPNASDRAEVQSWITSLDASQGGVSAGSVDATPAPQ